MSEKKDLNEFLTTEELAILLKKNVATVQRWCREGLLPAAKIGRSYIIRKKDFEDWYQSKLSMGHMLKTNKNTQ